MSPGVSPMHCGKGTRQYMLLNTQGNTPWHHPQSGSHWLRLQPRGAWTYGSHTAMADRICRNFGWRRALSVMNMGSPSFQDFTMRSAIENHMTNEDLGPEATKQDRADFDTLRDQLKWWESTIFSLGHPAKETNRWTQVPLQEQDRKKSQQRHRGRGARQGKTKAVSCFHPNTRVRMFRPDNSGPEY